MFTILYVDDEPDLLVLGRQFLERSPEFRVLPMSSAPEALSSPGITCCDAIVSDYQMPDMDGIEFLKAVRQQHGDIPFILFTGRGREEIVIQAINNGADFYLQKGGDAKAQFAELEHKIRQAVARRQAEHLLVESEKRLADIINFLPDATFAIDREGRVIAWNRAIVEMTGASAAEMLGKGNHEYTMPFYGDRRKALIDMVFEPDEVLSQHYTHISRSRGILTGETSISTPDGRHRILMATARPLYDRDGGIAGAIESLRDISGMRDAEVALRASEEKYRMVVEHSQDAIYIHRSDRVLFANSRAAELTGYPHDELMAIRLWDLVHPDDRAGLMENAKKRLAGDVIPPGFTARLTTKDGQIIPCEFFVDLIDYLGAPAILGIARDIRVRKEAEDSLRASEARFRELAELLPQIIFETDSDFRITYVNRHARTVTGLTPEDLAQKYSVFDVIAEKDHARAKESIGKIIRGDPIDHLEYEVIRRDGTSFTALIFAAPILQEGACAGLRGVVVDVSERKRTERELRTAYEKLAAQEKTLRRQYEELATSEENLRATQVSVDQAAFGVLWLSPEGSIIYVNDAQCRMLGYTREELLDMSIWDITPGHGPAQYAERWKQLKNVKSWLFETEHRTKDGRIYPVEVIGKYFSFGGREIYYAFEQDITGRKQAEEALRKSEVQFRELGEYMPQVIFETDREFKVTYVNRLARDLTGLTQEDLDRGFSVFDFIAPKDHERIRQNTVTVIRGDCDYEHEYTAILRDGTNLSVMIYAAPILHDGTFAGLRGMVIDVTEKKRAEEALRASEDKYRHILDNLQDAYLRMDRGGTLTMVNQSAARIYGYRSPDDMIGMSVSALFRDPGQRDGIRKLLDKDGMVSDLSGEGLRKDGSFVWVSISARYLRDNEGHVIGTEAISRDITERKVMEHAIQETNRKLNLLNNITRHDVINQLTALHGYVQLAGTKKPDPVVMDYLDRIAEAAGTVGRQIAFTQDYQELGVRAPSWFALDEVVTKASGTAVPVRFSGTCHAVSVLADPMLERVFFNLFENAVRHGRSVTGITVRCEREQNGLFVIVEDDGIGVKPHEKEKIFAKGYGKNTGFGLFLTKEILAITGITIRETGTFGKGARFELFVPEGAYRQPGKKGKKVQTPASEGKKVLP